MKRLMWWLQFLVIGPLAVVAGYASVYDGLVFLGALLIVTGTAYTAVFGAGALADLERDEEEP